MNRGYVKLWRKMMDHGMMQNSHLVHVWIWCLMKASHKPHSFMVGFTKIDLLPGQFVFGRKTCSTETGISEQSIRTCLVALQSNQQLTIKPTNKFSIISICKWDSYQNENNQTNQLTNQHINQQLTNNQPTTNQQLTTNKNDKNVKNDKNNTPADFAAFWLLYPKKVGKKKAIKEWMNAKDRPSIEAISKAVSSQAVTEQWRKDGGKYIPHPATWISEGRWDDCTVVVVQRESASVPERVKTSDELFSELCFDLSYVKNNPSMTKNTILKARRMAISEDIIKEAIKQTGVIVSL